MTFKEFAKWCNNRAHDGCWGLNEAWICSNVVGDIYKKPFWKRGKIWRNEYKESVMPIVNATNDIIDKWKNEYKDKLAESDV